MANREFQKAACASCGGKIEFPADAQGMTVECPHCHAQTELQPLEITPRNTSRFLGFGFLGIVAAVGILMLLKSRSTERPEPQEPRSVGTNPSVTLAEAARPRSLEDLKVAGPVSIEKAKNGRLSYAMGTLTNDSEHQRFGVKVEVELFDSAGNKLPTMANDYVQTLEPRKEWNFRALVLEPKAVTAKVAAISED